MKFNEQMLRRKLCERDQTMRSFAVDVLGITPCTLGKKILGKSDWKMLELERIRDYFDLTPDEQCRMFGIR